MPKKRESPYLDGLIDKYIKRAKGFYPGLEFGSRFSLYSGDEPRHCKLEFSLKSKNLINTEYHVKRKYDVIHYTSSLQNVIEILNSGLFRLSNLIALNDPQELRFIINNLKMDFNKKQIEKYKSHFFCGSFCRVLNKKKPDEFPMWRLYGDDGFGAAIIFEIVNYEKDWSNFLISKVQYGDAKSVSRYNEFMDFHNLFQKENNQPLQSGDLPYALTALMALHKNKIWEYEKEIRILTYNEYDHLYTLKSNEPHICEVKHSVLKNGKKYSFVELPLLGSKEFRRISKIINEASSNYLNNRFPIIKVKEVILGYRIEDTVVSNVEDIVAYVSNSFGYQINIRKSHLSEHMH
ncbi:hypothetical protein DJ568_08800 [Mucilaginibacter hurinus]|uniref:DUF2971 domain-containing protein n=1 Tax=Mucilaginibacter hurinus TaxID=2201324 RepID=A0A367GRD9_9SPHI|nr:DUF2971 domain-containing protein [Mucilaginibacter hurinus]RCH55273.1 hypothetical protein DJ568_08800 [Mucilaginibacter hurinus]